MPGPADPNLGPGGVLNNAANALNQVATILEQRRAQKEAEAKQRDLLATQNDMQNALQIATNYEKAADIAEKAGTPEALARAGAYRAQATKLRTSSSLAIRDPQAFQAQYADLTSGVTLPGTPGSTTLKPGAGVTSSPGASDVTFTQGTPDQTFTQSDIGRLQGQDQQYALDQDQAKKDKAEKDKQYRDAAVNVLNNLDLPIEVRQKASDFLLGKSTDMSWLTPAKPADKPKPVTAEDAVKLLGDKRAELQKNLDILPANSPEATAAQQLIDQLNKAIADAGQNPQAAIDLAGRAESLSVSLPGQGTPGSTTLKPGAGQTSSPGASDVSYTPGSEDYKPGQTVSTGDIRTAARVASQNQDTLKTWKDTATKLQGSANPTLAAAATIVANATDLTPEVKDAWNTITQNASAGELWTASTAPIASYRTNLQTYLAKAKQPGSGADPNAVKWAEDALQQLDGLEASGAKDPITALHTLETVRKGYTDPNGNVYNLNNLGAATETAARTLTKAWSAEDRQAAIAQGIDNASLDGVLTVANDTTGAYTPQQVADAKKIVADLRAGKPVDLAAVPAFAKLAYTPDVLTKAITAGDWKTANAAYNYLEQSGVDVSKFDKKAIDAGYAGDLAKDTGNLGANLSDLTSRGDVTTLNRMKDGLIASGQFTEEDFTGPDGYLTKAQANLTRQQEAQRLQDIANNRANATGAQDYLHKTYFSGALPDMKGLDALADKSDDELAKLGLTRDDIKRAVGKAQITGYLGTVDLVNKLDGMSAAEALKQMNDPNSAVNQAAKQFNVDLTPFRKDIETRAAEEERAKQDQNYGTALKYRDNWASQMASGDIGKSWAAIRNNPAFERTWKALGYSSAVEFFDDMKGRAQKVQAKDATATVTNKMPVWLDPDAPFDPKTVLNPGTAAGKEFATAATALGFSSPLAFSQYITKKRDLATKERQLATEDNATKRQLLQLDITKTRAEIANIEANTVYTKTQKGQSAGKPYSPYNDPQVRFLQTQQTHAREQAATFQTQINAIYTKYGKNSVSGKPNPVTDPADQTRLAQLQGNLDYWNGESERILKTLNTLTQPPEAGAPSASAQVVAPYAQTLASNLGINPNHVMAVIGFETAGSFSPTAKNPNSSATGLFQIMDSTAQGMGYKNSADFLAKNPSPEAQMREFERYLKSRGVGPGSSLSDIYVAVTGGAKPGAPDSTVLYKKGSPQYNANPAWDVNNDGIITKGEIAQALQPFVKNYYPNATGTGTGQSTGQGNPTPGATPTPQPTSTGFKVGKVAVPTSAVTTYKDIPAGDQTKLAAYLTQWSKTLGLTPEQTYEVFEKMAATASTPPSARPTPPPQPSAPITPGGGTGGGITPGGIGGAYGR